MHKYNSLTPDILRILRDKGTEPAFSSQFHDVIQRGTYLCRGCGQALFRGDNQFTSHCGWPSFDDEIANTVIQTPDADGIRTEILCARCHGHLGHAFTGEGYTQRNLRHCVNALAIEFVESETVLNTEEAIVAGGCFWGIEYLFRQLSGVLKTEVGYIGGHLSEPCYEDVCGKASGHYEAVRVVFDPTHISYDKILRAFFEMHDPGDTEGQGPDKGPQYLSAVFCYDENQKQVASTLIHKLIELGYDVATNIFSVTPFWHAETYHQDYYGKTGKAPYCHKWVKKFKDND